MIRIRPATTDDLDWLIHELKEFSLFYGTKNGLFSTEEYTRHGMTTLMKDHLVFVAEKDYVGPVGFIAGLYSHHIFNPTIRVLTEAFWWVPEQHRRSRAGYLLLQAFVDFGKENADWILFTLEHNSPVNPNALIDRGFKLKERSFLMEV